MQGHTLKHFLFIDPFTLLINIFSCYYAHSALKSFKNEYDMNSTFKNLISVGERISYAYT